ncbi:glycosyltransferase [Actinoplanes couchii]|uniref:Glycosyltransferase 2-like domain-containing protein n=1 Tax=Actinoplanes couchii TaxID=403638 RepID=A0ABQ3X2S0_9ACTN|nr:glycosyltransferase [Actinoplanes couchii]MDR6322530.1 hypothetical protein [Actinoplanes couchii]GID52763.1 hypothetical protein Aco03nite_011670 [Actinoplanes couchii]
MLQSRTTRRALAAAAVLLAVTAATGYVHREVDSLALFACWCAGYGTLLVRAWSFVRNGRVPRPAAATARIVAIVPACAPDDADLRACVWSLLNQHGVVVGEVHVVDDGPVNRPVRPFAHPRVHWHHRLDGGSRPAALHVLDRLEPADWDFVLTLDGDCVLDDHALEHLLEVFTDPRVTVAKPMIAARNAGQNMLTRIADVHLGTARGLRMSRPLPGAGLCRAGVAFQDRDHHRGGSAAFEGEVLVVPAATVWTRAPADRDAAYRQWLRWSTTWWRTFGRVVPAARMLAGSLAVGYASVALVTGPVRSGPAALYATLYLLVRYAMTGLYLVDRPRTSGPDRFWTWLLLTPAEAALNLLFVVPVRYIALLRLCRSRSRSSTAGPGTVYHSAHLLEGNRT